MGLVFVLGQESRRSKKAPNSACSGQVSTHRTLRGQAFFAASGFYVSTASLVPPTCHKREPLGAQLKPRNGKVKQVL